MSACHRWRNKMFYLWLVCGFRFIRVCSGHRVPQSPVDSTCLRRQVWPHVFRLYQAHAVCPYVFRLQQAHDVCPHVPSAAGINFLPTHLLSADTCTVCSRHEPSTADTSRLQQTLAVYSRHVPSTADTCCLQQTRALCRHMFCVSTHVLCVNTCAVCRHTCRLQQACAVCRHMCCLQTHLLSADTCAVCRYLPTHVLTTAARVVMSLVAGTGEGGWFFIFRFFTSILFCVNWISLFFFHVL